MELALLLSEPCAKGQKMTTQNLTLLNAMVQKMDWLEERQKVIAQNISNADTPGYRPNDVMPIDFKSLLSKSTSSLSLGAASAAGGIKMASAAQGLAVTNSAHMNLGGTQNAGAKAMAKQDKHPYEVAPAGNAVVLEEQLLKMNETYTDHRFITNLYQKNIDMLKTAIKSQ
jgi:flagellar basal-body rod protein FlgB